MCAITAAQIHKRVNNMLCLGPLGGCGLAACGHHSQSAAHSSFTAPCQTPSAGCLSRLSVLIRHTHVASIACYHANGEAPS